MNKKPLYLGASVLVVLVVCRFAVNGLFSLAAYNGDVKTMRLLHRVGANVDEREEGRTALLVAVERNQPQVVECLLQMGADPNLPYPNGVTPLQSARGEGFETVVALLKKYGAK